MGIIRTAVLTTSLRVYKAQFLYSIDPEDHDKFKPVTRMDDLEGERFLNYVKLWDFKDNRHAREIEDLAKARLIHPDLKRQ